MSSCDNSSEEEFDFDKKFDDRESHSQPLSEEAQQTPSDAIAPVSACRVSEEEVDEIIGLLAAEENETKEIDVVSSIRENTCNEKLAPASQPSQPSQASQLTQRDVKDDSLSTANLEPVVAQDTSAPSNTLVIATATETVLTCIRGHCHRSRYRKKMCKYHYYKWYYQQPPTMVPRRKSRKRVMVDGKLVPSTS